MNKKFISLMLTATMTATMLAGCGSEPAATEKTEEPAKTETAAPAETETAKEEADAPASDVELTYWSMWSSAEPQGKVIQEAADAFKEKTGVTVNIEWKNRDIKTILATALEAKEKVDIFEDDYTRIAKNLGDYCYDLTDMAKAAGYENQSFKCFNDNATEWAGGKLPCITAQPSVGGIFYNKDIFEDCGITEVPTTWDEFMTACQAMVDKGYEPMALDTAYASFFWGYHLDRMIGEATTTELSQNGGWSKNEGVAKAADLIIDFVDKGYLADGAPDEYPSSQNKIGLTGKVAMVVCANYVCPEVNNNTGTEINWGLFNYPTIEGGSGSTNAFAGANSLGIASYTEHPQEAFDFVMFLTSGEFDQKKADIADQIPADPRNTEPAINEGSIETLKATSAPLTWNMGFTSNSDLGPSLTDVVVQLFEGKFKTGADFAAALDALY